MAKEIIMRGLDKIITGSGTELNLENIQSSSNTGFQAVADLNNIDVSGSGNFSGVLTGNTTIKFINGDIGNYGMLYLDNRGDHVISFDSSVEFTDSAFLSDGTLSGSKVFLFRYMAGTDKVTLSYENSAEENVGVPAQAASGGVIQMNRTGRYSQILSSTGDTGADGSWSVGNWFNNDNANFEMMHGFDGRDYWGGEIPDCMMYSFTLTTTSPFYQNNNPNAGPPDMQLVFYSKWDTEVGNTNLTYTNNLYALMFGGNSSYYGYSGLHDRSYDTTNWTGYDGNSTYAMTANAYQWHSSSNESYTLDTWNGDVSWTSGGGATTSYNFLR